MKTQMVRRFISAIVAVAVLLTAFPAVFAEDKHSTYTDFPAGWSETAVGHAVDNGLLTGRTATEIEPQGNLTRAEMATIINRAFGAKIKADISGYTDVTPSDWFYSEIAKAVNMRTFIGDSSTTMNPDEFITREAVFTVIARALVLETEDFSPLSRFPDGDKVSDWAKSAASVLLSKGYVNGNDQGNLCPRCYITREEFAQIMYNIVKTYYIEDGEFSHTGKDSSLIRTSDVTLRDVTIDGDLIIGDGVGNGTVILENVTINGRLLCRSGEKAIRLVNTTVKEHVVVFDVNGIVHFDNYRTETVFKGIRMLTPATFRIKVNGYTGGSSDGPDGPDDPQPQYYTVSFHNGGNPVVFDTAKIDKSSEEKTLKSINKALNTIYEDYLIATPLYTYNRNALGYNVLGTSYEHAVNKEFIYYDDVENTWSVFTDETPVNKDIDVYYAVKSSIVEADAPVLSTPYSAQIVYDSESRIADSVKDYMIETGLTLENPIVKGEIDAKMLEMYQKLNTETGLVDTEGNILDTNFSLRIIDVIEGSEIRARVKTSIEEILNGPEEELEDVISLFDIPTLVDQIGGKKLIELMDVATIRTMLKDPRFQGTVVAFIQNKIKNDTTVIESVLNSPAKNTLIETAAANNAFVAKLLDLQLFQNEVLDAVKSNQIKDSLIACLNNAAVKDEIIGIIKADNDFKGKLTGTDQTLRKLLVSEVAEPGSVYEANGSRPIMTDSAKKIRNEVVNIINTDSDFESFRSMITNPLVYESIVYQYATGRSFQGAPIRVGPAHLNMIDSVITDMINKYFSSDASAMSADLKAVIDGSIVNFAKKYVNSETINADIEDAIEKNIIIFVKGYFAGTSTLINNVEINAVADDIKEVFIGKIKTANVNDIKQPIIDYVTDPNNATFIDNFVASNYTSIVDAVDDAFIQSYIETMSEDDAKTLVKQHATVDMIVTYIVGLSDRTPLVNAILQMLDTYPPYQNFIAEFENGNSEFEINKSNTHFVRAVGREICGFDFNEILGILNNRGFGPILNFLGEEVVESTIKASFDDSKLRYWQQLEPVIVSVEQSSDPNVKEYYTTSMEFIFELPQIIKGIYDNMAAKFKATIEGNDIYDYNRNIALQKVVNLNWFDLMIGYDANRETLNPEVTGYYIKDYMDYYCSILDISILFDDALCFYNADDYTDEELILVKKSLSKEFLNFLKKLEELPEKIENGEAFLGGSTLQDLVDKVDSLEGALESFGGTSGESQLSGLTSVIDNLRNILTDLGEGNLPGGYTLEELSILSDKLQTVINGMNENQYASVNETFKSLITDSLTRIGNIMKNLDENGIDVDNMLSGISFFTNIYRTYSQQIESIISALADADLGSIDVPFDSEKYEDMIFGREEDNVFNIDNAIDVIKSKLGDNQKTGYEGTTYIVDQYEKVFGDYSVFIQRKFH